MVLIINDINHNYGTQDHLRANDLLFLYIYYIYNHMLLMEIVKNLLVEKMTFGQLFRSSTPSRKQRAKDMQFVNRLPVRAQKTDDYWDFRYKSGQSNNTTGDSHRGRITFLKPTKGKFGESVYCEVDCGCPDYRYRWAYANSRRDASPMGSQSINQCNGSPARITNPKSRPGLCKHLLTLKNQIHTRLKESQQPTVEQKLDEIVANHPEFEITVHD